MKLFKPCNPASNLFFTFVSREKELETTADIKGLGNKVQWNLDLTKSLGTGQICSLNGGFVISKTSI